MDDKRPARGVRVTRSTLQDLAELGVPLPAGVTVTDAVDADTIMICLALDFDHPLMFPNNKHGLCSLGCGQRIQYRPHVPDNVRKACMACALAEGDAR